MIDKIAILFGKDSISISPEKNTYLDYTWFLSESQEVFGIKNSRMSNEQKSLLSGIFTKLELDTLLFPTAHNDWNEYLFNHNGKNPFGIEDESKLPVSVRFIHFYSNQLFTNKAEFEEAIHAFFHKEVLIIWSSSKEGVIIEKIDDQPLHHSFLEHMQEIIAADLYHDVSFFVGKHYNPLSDLHLYYDIEHQCFLKAIKLKKQNKVLWFSKEMINYILSFLPIELQNELPKLFLNDMKLEDTILSTVKIYLQNNINVTATSKQAFLHRNTVQYRLDKFTEQTGIDLKHFEDGLVVYLAVRLLEIIE